MNSPGKDPIKDIIEGDFSARIHELSPDICTYSAAAERIETWRDEGHFSVLNAGTYDLLTLNHILGLVQCRTLGAMSLLGIDSIETMQDQHLVHDVAASDSVHLMVTLDTNRGLAETKSRRPEKGGAPKPILDWQSRANMLAMQSIPSPGYETRRGIVDYITRHGPDCCAVCDSGTCIHEDNALMTVELQPDMVVVNAASNRTVKDIEHYQAAGLLPATQIALVVEEEAQYYDPILDGPIKTTTIVRRVRS